ncbi:MAG: hypothetical protein MZV70_71175 [Desulfobacterales bacterium]|nr:hypothetical protein [Desulfobacterales bacterium]
MTKDQYVHIGDSDHQHQPPRAPPDRAISPTSPRRSSTSRPTRTCPTASSSAIMDITKKAGVEIVGIITEPIDVKDKRK